MLRKSRPTGRGAALRALIALLLLLPLHAAAFAQDLTDLTLEELINVEVTSVSRRPERWLTAPAAVHVITQEDIRRSGVTTIAEALRLAPGVEVARIDANRWAIGIRGFGSRLARSVLVLIDGRSVYNPLFAGTYWEIQDLVLEDVARIEVIRGPGGTLWGANAFNGVINITTRSARQTHGALATAGVGNEERGFAAVRYGGAAAGDRLHYRAYGKIFNRHSALPRAGNFYDHWRLGQLGFRTDWDVRERDGVTTQGDLYVGSIGQRAIVSSFDPQGNQTLETPSKVWGGNVLGRWQHQFSATSSSKLQLYYDHTSRTDPSFEEDRETVDLDFDHNLQLPGRQELVWGLGYRLTYGRTGGVPTVTFTPANRVDHLVSAFVQDSIALLPDLLTFTAGTKLEHNDFTGVEVQPSARLAWTPGGGRHVAWAAFSRAVRTPSPVEHDVQINVFVPAQGAYVRYVGTRDFTSEVVYATEAGYRYQPSARLSSGVAAFFNNYRDLLSVEPGPPFQESPPDPALQPRTILPFFIRNGLLGRTYGFEGRADWAARRWLEVHAAYSYLRIELRTRPGSIDTTTVPMTEGSSPHHQISLRAEMNLPRGFELDVITRFVSGLPAQGVAAYVNADLRLGWRPRPDFELSVIGQNLLARSHPEFAGNSVDAVEIERSVYGKVTLRW